MTCMICMIQLHVAGRETYTNLHDLLTQGTVFRGIDLLYIVQVLHKPVPGTIIAEG